MNVCQLSAYPQFYCDAAGICRSTQHPLPGDICQERHECRAGFPDNGEADQGPVSSSASWEVYQLERFTKG